MLSGVETTKEKVLRIILAGQPELNDKLDAPELEQLTQRVRLRFHLQTLSESETRAYIQHRLDVAGAGDRDLFAADTFPEIFRYTGGVPRLVNTLCDTAMMAAFTADRDRVTRVDIASAVRGAAVGRRITRARIATGRSIQGAVHAAQLPPPRCCSRHRRRRSRGALGHVLVATDGRTVHEVPLRTGRSSSAAPPTTTCRSTAASSAATTARSSPPTHSCVIEDLNSTNGIYVKSNRVRRHYLNDGDVVLVGKHELIYVDERASRARASPLSGTLAQVRAATEALGEDDDEEAPAGAAPLREP